MTSMARLSQAANRARVERNRRRILHGAIGLAVAIGLAIVWIPRPAGGVSTEGDSIFRLTPAALPGSLNGTGAAALQSSGPTRSGSTPSAAPVHGEPGSSTGPAGLPSDAMPGQRLPLTSGRSPAEGGSMGLDGPAGPCPRPLVADTQPLSGRGTTGHVGHGSMGLWRVTAYDANCQICGTTGTTASGAKAQGHLVAADWNVLPKGSWVRVPGYAGGSWVQVLDRGGAIKGNRLDVLCKTHADAVRWGVRYLNVEIQHGR